MQATSLIRGDVKSRASVLLTVTDGALRDPDEAATAVSVCVCVCVCVCV